MKASVLGFLHSFSFGWPSLLWLLLLVPLAVAAYVLALHRRKKNAVRYGNMVLVRRAVSAGTWRRHMPPALFLVALTLLIIAVARPTADVTLPSTSATVLLAMDVSGSMRAGDVQPSRIVASQNAARQYIKDQPRNVRIGIVDFASIALLVQPPTTDRNALYSAIDGFELQRGTAVGSGIMVALGALFPEAEDLHVSQFQNLGGGGFSGVEYQGRRYDGGAAVDGNSGNGEKTHKPVEPGSYKNAVIILLTDGQTNARLRSHRGRAQGAGIWRAHLHRRLRHQTRQHRGLWRLFHARPAGRGLSEEDRRHDAGPLFPRRQRGRSEGRL